MSKRKKRPLLLIEWLDHTESATDGWIGADKRDEHSGEATIVSIGWLMKNTKNAYIISATVCKDDGSTGALWTILKKAVIAKIILPSKFALETMQEDE